MLVLYWLLIRRNASEEGLEMAAIGTAILGITVFLAVVSSSVEAIAWLWDTSQASLLWIITPILWTAGAGLLQALGRAERSPGLYHTSLLMLTCAALLAIGGYSAPLSEGAWLLLNPRFLIAALVVAALFTQGVVTRRWIAFEDISIDALRREGAALYSIGGLAIIVLLSVETGLYFHQTEPDPNRARWLAQMGLTMVWSVSAAVVVALGFWRNHRALRLAGLALFGVVALKLLLVDTAQVDGGYRVASFMVVGTLMIGASYLYHRLERWMSVRSA